MQDTGEENIDVLPELRIGDRMKTIELMIRKRETVELGELYPAGVSGLIQGLGFKYENNILWGSDTVLATIYTKDGVEVILPHCPESSDFQRRFQEMVETLAIATKMDESNMVGLIRKVLK